MLNFQWDNYKFTLVQLGEGIFFKNMAGHSHSKNSYEFHYIIGGEGTLTLDSAVYNLSKGDFFVTGPNVYHQQSTNKENPLKEIFIYIQAAEMKTKSSLVSTFLANHFYYEKENKLEDIFLKLIEEDTNRKWGYENIISALLQQLLTEITRLYWPNFSGTTQNHENLNDRRFIIIETAFIDDPKGITLAKLSDMIGLCERQTQRLLEKYYNKSFSEKKAEAKLTRHI